MWQCTYVIKRNNMEMNMDEALHVIYSETCIIVEHYVCMYKPHMPPLYHRADQLSNLTNATSMKTATEIYNQIIAKYLLIIITIRVCSLLLYNPGNRVRIHFKS